MAPARALVIGAALLAAGCLGPSDVGVSPPPDGVGVPGAIVETPQGTMTFLLYPDLAPATVAQFERLVATGFYNGSVFHRTVDNFVIQGGAPPEGREEADTIPLEPGGYFAAGTLGIARDAEPDTGTSQFFVCEYPQPHLRDPDALQSALSVAYGRFTAFGQLVEGMDVVRAINELPHDESGEDRPQDPPPMTVRLTQVRLTSEEAAELPYRTWGRELAPPYRVSLASPGTLPVNAPTWLRLYIEDQVDRGAQTGVAPTIEVASAQGEPVEHALETLAADGNIHAVTLTFPGPGAYTVSVADGLRPLATFNVRAG